jgi:hypothetical protein
MVAIPDEYTFRRTFLNALNPTVRIAVLKAGRTPEFSKIKELYREALKYDEAIRYDAGMTRAAAGGSSVPPKKPEEPRKPPVGNAPQRLGFGQAQSRFAPRPAYASNQTRAQPYRPPGQTATPGEKPLPPPPPPKPPVVTGGTLPVGNNHNSSNVTCFQCGQTGHMRNYCPQLRNKPRVAGVRFDEELIEYDSPANGEDEPVEPHEEEETDGFQFDQDPHTDWYDDQSYPLEEVPQDEPEDTHYSVGGVRYPNYEYRRGSLFAVVGQATPPIKVSAASTKELAEPMYDHRTRAKDQPRPPRGHPSNEVFTVYMSVGGELAYCLLDCGCEGVLVAADYARAVHLPMKRLAKPVTLQLACQGSKSMINHGVVTQTDVAGKITDEYFDVANVDYYDVILGTPFLRRFQVKLDFTGNGEIIIGGNSYKPGGVISPSKALSGNTSTKSQP